MKPIKKNEIFGHLTDFLKTRGIELKEGSYAQSIQKGCSILTDTINLSQQGLEQAKGQIDKQVDTMRQVIHEHTAPKSAKAGAEPKKAKSSAKGQANRSSARKGQKSQK